MSKEVILKTHTSGNYYYPIHIVLNNLGDGDITDLVRDANVKWGCGIKNISTLSREIRAVLKAFGATDVSILRSSTDYDLSVSRRVKNSRMVRVLLMGMLLRLYQTESGVIRLVLSCK